MRLTEPGAKLVPAAAPVASAGPASPGVSVYVERRYGVSKKRFLGFAQAECGQTPTETAEAGRKALFLPAAPADRTSL